MATMGRSPFVAAVVTTVWLGLALGCKPSGGGGGGGGGPAPSSTSTATATSADGGATPAAATPGTSPKTATANCPPATGLQLADVSYQADIEPLLDAYCITCHRPGGPAPGQDLTTYAGAKQFAAASLAQIQAGRMPQGSAPLASADVTKFQAWIAGGMLESSGGGQPVAGAPTDPAGTATPAPATPCGTPVATTPASNGGSALPPGATAGGSPGLPTAGNVTPATPTSSDPWSPLVNPPGFQDCVKAGRVFDRIGSQCTQTPVATTYPCTEAGIKQVFTGINVNVEAQLAGLLSQGFQPDQCGLLQSDPVVFFVHRVGTAIDPGFQVKYLCRMGSAACPVH